MTFTELCRSLPNGLHDSILDGIAVDFLARQVTMSVRVNVIGDSTESRQDLRRAEIRLRGVSALGIETTWAKNIGKDGLFDVASPMVDSGFGLPAPLGTDPRVVAAFQNCQELSWIFLEEWNSYVLLNASEAEIRWLD